MQFHIIYMPNTVRYLTPFVSSLLRWSDCTFKLVANGCDAAEEATLQQFCKNNSRLKFATLSVHEPVNHGMALNHLQSINRESTFCFMDSDIFATGPFMPEFTDRIDQYSGLFSGTPLWCIAGEGILSKEYPRMYGRYHHTESGICLGSSYFAIYDNQLLREVIRSTQIDFQSRFWPQIPKKHQQMLTRMGLARKAYDTGKLINLLMHHQGHKLWFCNVSTLPHLGGLSRFSADNATPILQRFTTAIRFLGKGEFRNLLLKLPYWIDFERLHLPRGKLAQRPLLRQASVQRYFTELIIAAVEKSTPPTWQPLVDDQKLERIRRVAAELQTLYFITKTERAW